MIDWRNNEAADYYVNQVIGLSTATDPHIDGVFVVSANRTPSLLQLLHSIA